MPLTEPTVGELLPENHEVVRDHFNFPRTHALYAIESSRGANGSEGEEIALAAQRLHGRCYVAFGYFTNEGLAPDGRLVPELDGTREDAGGYYEINYLLARSLDDHKAGATLRLIGTGEGGSVRDLPTCKYGLDDSAYQQIDAVLSEGGVIREIAALAVADKSHSVGSYELMRAVMQNALIKQTETGKKEVYIASLTDISLHPVKKFTGEIATREINDPINIFSTDHRAKDIVVTPVLIDPFVMVDAAIESAEQGLAEGSRAGLERLAFLMDGLETQHVPDAARNLLHQ